VRRFISPLFLTVPFLLAACATEPAGMSEEMDLPPGPASLDLEDRWAGTGSLPTAPGDDFTGCLEQGPCYVAGVQVDVRRRFEPHTGRVWFTDPATGRTYYEDGRPRSQRARPGA
jgi:hypothetical protein